MISPILWKEFTSKMRGRKTFLVQAVYLLLLTSLTFGVIGLFASTICRKTNIATAVTYGTVFLLVVGILFIGVLLDEFVFLGHPAIDFSWELVAPFSPFYSLGELLFNDNHGPWLTTVLSYSVLSLILYVAIITSFKLLSRKAY